MKAFRQERSTLINEEISPCGSRRDLKTISSRAFWWFFRSVIFYFTDLLQEESALEYQSFSELKWPSRRTDNCLLNNTFIWAFNSIFSIPCLMSVLNFLGFDQRAAAKVAVYLYVILNFTDAHFSRYFCPSFALWIAAQQRFCGGTGWKYFMIRKGNSLA